jgi:acylpyruvate hydrolase
MFGLIRYQVGSDFGIVHRLGALLPDERIVDLRNAFQAYLTQTGDPHAVAIAQARIPDDMRDFIRGGHHSLDAAKSAVGFATGAAGNEAASGHAGKLRLFFARADVSLLPPLLPGKIIGMGRNYAEHQAESSMPPADDFPRGFIKVNSTLVAGDADIPYPPMTGQLDYEVELAVVIGKAGVEIAPEDAESHVFGYTILNDLSARDWQLEERKKGNHVIGKNLMGLGPLGPAVIPREFIGDPMNLEVSLRINGERRQHANTRTMTYNLAQMIVHWSKMGLEPGDLISTGSPAGVALGRKPPDPSAYLKKGDVVEAEIESIGILRNRIV